VAYIPDEAIDRLCELSKGARHLYVFLARCRNQKTGLCCPSVAVTMSFLDCNRGTVYALRAELSEKQWAVFEGDKAVALLGFESLKIQTANAANEELTADSPKNQTTASESENSDSESLKNQTGSLKNQTKKSEKSDSHIRNNQQKEPANLTSKRESAPASAISDIRGYQRKARERPVEQSILGRFEFQEYLTYLENAYPAKSDGQRISLAGKLKKTGEDDEQIAAYLAAQKAKNNGNGTHAKPNGHSPLDGFGLNARRI